MQALNKDLFPHPVGRSNGDDAVFPTPQKGGFQIEAPEGFSAHSTYPAHTNPGLAVSGKRLTRFHQCCW